jgi:GNAT superfamily N-acetyltransferase
MITVRKATLEDQFHVYGMLCNCLREDSIGIPLSEDWGLTLLGDVMSTLAGKGGAIFIAEIDGKPAGVVRAWKSRLSPYHAPIATFGYIFVLPEHRGGKVAHRLCVAAYEWMKGSGCEYGVNFSSANTPHRANYNRYGFTDTATVMVGKL